MAPGPGKYDDLCTLVREQANAIGAVVIIIGGNAGSGFSVQGPEQLTPALPRLLETIAAQIRRDRAVPNGVEE